MPFIDVRVLSLTVPALKPASPNVPVIFVLGILLALLGGAVSAIVMEYRDPRVRSLTSLRRNTSGQLIGIIYSVADTLAFALNSVHTHAS